MLTSACALIALRGILLTLVPILIVVVSLGLSWCVLSKCSLRFSWLKPELRWCVSPSYEFIQRKHTMDKYLRLQVLSVKVESSESSKIWLYWKRTLWSSLRRIEDVKDEVILDILLICWILQSTSTLLIVLHSKLLSVDSTKCTWNQ